LSVRRFSGDVGAVFAAQKELGTPTLDGLVRQIRTIDDIRDRSSDASIVLMTTQCFNWIQNARKQPAEQKTMLGSMCRFTTCGALRQHRELHHQTGIDAPRLGYE